MRFLKQYGFIFILFGIELIIFVTNYTPHTYLIGWDTVMPEFNLRLNFIRSLFSIWQEYRGVGLLDGMSHAANLMHTVYIWLLSAVFPQHMLRYVFIHLCHVLGGIGMYVLVRQVAGKRVTCNTKHVTCSTKHVTCSTKHVTCSTEHATGYMLHVTRPTLHAPPLLAALFYMFNAGIIQQFYAPLEVFAIHFAFLPFLTLSLLHLLHAPTRKNILLFFIVNLLASPQGFVPTVFIVYMLFVGWILAFHFLRTKKWRAIVIAGVVIVTANAFWLFPYAYSALNTPRIIKQAKINQYSSEEIFYRNKAKGDVWHVLSMQGFMLDTIELDTKTNDEVFFMPAWRQHANNPLVILWIIVQIALLCFGIAHVVQAREKLLSPFVFGFLTAFFFLANNTPVLEQANTLFRAGFPLLGEAFRFPFTKFITLFAFTYTMLLVHGLFFAEMLLHKTRFDARHKHHISRASFVVCCLIFMYSVLPVFTGNFTSPFLRLVLPTDYTDLFAYFNTQDATQRIALLPATSYWNWQYKTWQFRGSGFHWYAIPQATMHRAFDPWSNYNEQFYNEIATAINTDNSRLFTNVVQKYAITHLVLDEYSINALTKKPINYVQLEAFLATQPGINKEQTFGKIIVYKVVNPTPRVAAIHNIQTVFPAVSYTKEDIYPLPYTISETQPDIVSFFPTLYTEKLQENLEFAVEETLTGYMFTPKTLPQVSLADYTLTIPPLVNESYLVPVAFSVRENKVQMTLLYPEITINGKQIALQQEPVIKPIEVSDAKTVTIRDTGQVVRLEQPAYGYLLNNQINTITIQGEKTKQDIYVDPSDFKDRQQTVSVPTGQLQKVVITIQKVQSPFASDTLLATLKTFTHNGLLAVGSAQAIRTDALTLTAQQKSIEATTFIPELPHQQSYLVLIDADHKSGLLPEWYVDNTFQNRAEVDGKLARGENRNVFVLSKSEDYFKGYGIHILIRSVGTETAETTVKRITIHPFPERWLQHIQLTKNRQTPHAEAQALPFNRDTITAYHTTVPTGSGTLLLAEGYDTGWRAYRIGDRNVFTNIFPFVFGSQLKEHRVINGWANGWTYQAEKPETIILVYLPQYIQFAGQMVTIVSFTGILALGMRFKRKNEASRTENG